MLYADFAYIERFNRGDPKINKMKKKIYFENLDGLRFFCFLSVFFYHSFYTNFDYIKSKYLYHFIEQDIFGNGNLGVNFFFVLSGFLITYLLIEEKNLNGQINVKKFWIRRILRIWPLFFLCVIFGFFIFPLLKSAFGQQPNETASIGYYLSFTNNFDLIENGLPDASILGILWSVAIEEQFYFVWPIILYFLPIKHQWIAFSTIIVGSLIFRAYNNNYWDHEFHTLSCIGDMATGAFGAWLILINKNFKKQIQNLKGIYIFLAYISFFLLFFFRDEVLSHEIFLLDIIERPLIALIILLIILEQSFSEKSYFKMKRFRILTRLGTYTYGLYCLHPIGVLTTITLTNKFHFNTELWQVMITDTIFSLLLTILISLVSYHYYEKPFLKLKSKFAYFTK